MLNSGLMGGRNADRGSSASRGQARAFVFSTGAPPLHVHGGKTTSVPAAGRGSALAGDCSRLPLKYLLWLDNSAFTNSAMQLMRLLLPLFINRRVCCMCGRRRAGGRHARSLPCNAGRSKSICIPSAVKPLVRAPLRLRLQPRGLWGGSRRRLQPLHSLREGSESSA